MPRWTPEPLWAEQDAFIIGGGPSLATFNWDCLKGRCTIGCNSAYKLGADICKICFFGDQSFWMEHKNKLEHFEGLVITNSRNFLKESPPWLYVVERRGKGVHADQPGWNGNSGACVINLALIMGARRVFLLGFDMKAKKDQVNWYCAPGSKKPQPYRRFLDSFNLIAKECESVFPDREVINANDDSDLRVFPAITMAELQEELS